LADRSPTTTRLRFGLFEADSHSGELWKSGHKVKLQELPFRLLIALLERSGDVVSREELQITLWGRPGAGDFDHSIAIAVNKVREALGDSAENPRYIQTLARRGYRFIAPVTHVAEEQPFKISLISHTDVPPQEEPRLALAREGEAFGTMPAVGGLLAETRPAFPRKQAQPEIQTTGPIRTLRVFRSAAALALMVAMLFCAYYLGWKHHTNHIYAIRQLTSDGRILPAPRAMESFPATIANGSDLFTSIIEDGHPEVEQIEVADGRGTPLNLPSEIAGPGLDAISPDGSKLLVRSHLSNESEQPLWIVPVGGGSAQRVANLLAHDATFMPDGKDILYASGDQLMIEHVGDGTSELFARLNGRAFWLRWSPDGTRLRFTLYDPITHTKSLQEITARDHTARPLLPHWDQKRDTCCGIWTSNGASFIFQASQDNESDIWRLRGDSDRSPERLTNGPLMYQSPIASPSSEKVFFSGVALRSQLQRYDGSLHSFVSFNNFFADANRLEFTRDRQWVAWVDGSGKLWRAGANGTDKLQLTPDSMQVFLAHWSPDGKQLAIMARQPDQAWQIYLVGRNGGTLEKALGESRNEADPTWSPDGKLLAFGRVPDLMGKEDASRMIQILNLETHQVSVLAGSDGLFSPRWSPDGRYIAALPLDQSSLRVFTIGTNSWRVLVSRSVADPVWSSDSKYIYAHAFMEPTQSVYRVNVLDAHEGEDFTPTGAQNSSTLDYYFCGLMPDDSPVIRVRSATGNLYSLSLERENN
jgi:Tol biopolymer transport system component/DNA-binding winged helix-turn-helix (wHTH) protein